MNSCKCEWVKDRAAELWRRAGCPDSRDLDFWLAAERQYDSTYKGQLCILNPGSCPFQIEQAVTKGGHVAVCTRPATDKCRYRAIAKLEAKHE